jgi:long-chain acyl-CoA synthetase
MSDDLRRRPGDETPLAMFDRRVAELGDAPLLHLFETPFAASAVAALVDGLATGLAGLGVRAGDRVGLYLQNDPQFVIATLAAWRLGAITVPVNPMMRARELAKQLGDSGARTLIALDVLHRDVSAAVAADLGLEVVVTTGKDDLRADPVPAPEGGHAFLDLAGRAPRPEVFAAPGPEDVAVLTYTSGTTGPAKGAMNTHGNIAFASRVYRDRLGTTADDVILGIAPLYHVTGLTAHIGLALATGAPIVLAHRFDPAVTGRLIEHHRTTVTVAAITAFVALANDERATSHDLSSMRRAFSGGAPIAPGTVADLERRTGLVIRPVYGLTETTGPTHIAPRDEPVPVHAATGALSVGLPAPDTHVRILGEDGAPLPVGEVGEVAVAGPQVVPGYWEREEETANAFHGGELRTGDVGVVDEAGWLYLVDRRKDMIVASGFKVWPREVEDVLYEHEAVREAAVIGVADDYRGQSVHAYVSLKSGADATEQELIAHCRERIAAYKYPRRVVILEELPKTTTGKILRRELREQAANG